ncbi:protein BIG GRAIN 1-like B [Neltuma alba]|uniref:protein BIG GRAIN 1-like B n=1 Tax=Neltuma alba TaxID=207710 RepID=UPI0010A39A8F|nr:protein BIG GRAIN 1-like B [Prosopis alba]
MEKWDHHQRHNRENPSFSSTLLDSIYRSFEAEEEKQQDRLVFYREKSMRKQKQSSNITTTSNKNFFDDGDVGETKKPNFRRNSLTEFDRRRARSNYNSNSFSVFSSSGSSDSSSGYGFSSSESESWYKMQKPKPIRTSMSSSIRPQSSTFEAPDNFRTHSAQTQKSNHEKNGSSKAKSKALKILYGDLKKSKQPISPGARLASFLHSLFNSSGNTKKTKSSSVSNSHESKVTQPPTCSSASSFSRSCLSKTPSSRSGAKRSVRFCPVSVIVDEDCRPCGQKNIMREDDQEKKRNHSNEELRFHVMKESRRVEEIARELLLKTKMKKEKEFEMKYGHDEDEEEDDGVSCSSSDLFELDNLSSIGIQRYREELPVYETTHFDTNRAIANGFIL